MTPTCPASAASARSRALHFDEAEVGCINAKAGKHHRDRPLHLDAAGHGLRLEASRDGARHSGDAQFSPTAVTDDVPPAAAPHHGRVLPVELLVNPVSGSRPRSDLPRPGQWRGDKAGGAPAPARQ